LATITALRTHTDEFRQFHRHESFPFVLGSGLLDLCDGAASGALLGLLVGTHPITFSFYCI
jgi:hypothetical protein